ncbi:MAG TPA: biotin--[acetyl-CoA-carboxylase] ligase [Acidimicrobiia bacterium]
MATPPHTLHLNVVSSTQDEARSRFHGVPVLITAARQTAGRGRNGAAWETADRAVSASLAFRPAWPVASWPIISAVAGLSALDVLGERARLKWPNDVVIDGGKVAGILVESDAAVVVVGIGINLWWPAPVAGAGSLHQSDPGPAECTRVAGEWAIAFLARMDRSPEDWGRREYEARSATVGAAVTWEPGGSGRAVAIAANGGLVVETADGTVVLDSGAVRSVRTAGDGSGAG